MIFQMSEPSSSTRVPKVSVPNGPSRILVAAMCFMVVILMACGTSYDKGWTWHSDVATILTFLRRHPKYELHGQVNCVALIKTLDDLCGVGEWGYRQYYDPCTGVTKMKADGGHSKVVLAILDNNTSGRVVQAVTQAVQQDLRRPQPSYLVYEHIMQEQEAWERALLSVKSTYFINRLGACESPNRQALIFVSELLPLTRKPRKRRGGVSLVAHTLEGSASPKIARSPCARLRAAVAVVGSIRVLNQQGLAFDDWKFGQWGYDAGGNVVLIDVASGVPFATVDERIMVYASGPGGLDFGGLCPRSADPIAGAITAMARARNVTTTTVNGTDDGANDLWRLYQSIKLLCMVQTIAISDDASSYRVHQSPTRAAVIDQVAVLFRNLRKSVHSDSTTSDPTEAVWNGLGVILQNRCSRNSSNVYMGNTSRL